MNDVGSHFLFSREERLRECTVFLSERLEQVQKCDCALDWVQRVVKHYSRLKQLPDVSEAESRGEVLKKDDLEVLHFPALQRSEQTQSVLGALGGTYLEELFLGRFELDQIAHFLDALAQEVVEEVHELQMSGLPSEVGVVEHLLRESCLGVETESFELHELDEEEFVDFDLHLQKEIQVLTEDGELGFFCGVVLVEAIETFEEIERADLVEDAGALDFEAPTLYHLASKLDSIIMLENASERLLLKNVLLLPLLHLGHDAIKSSIA